LVDALTGAEISHFPKCDDGLAGVLPAVSVDLAGGGMCSVKQHLDFEQQGPRQPTITARPLGIVHGLHRKMPRGGRFLYRGQTRTARHQQHGEQGQTKTKEGGWHNEKP
jgi:hypothetical protein